MDAQTLLDRLRREIGEIGADEAAAQAASGKRTLVDVREEPERAAGAPDPSMSLPRSRLELRLAESGLGAEQPLALICASGSRSLLAAETLRQIGFSDVRSVAGGFDAWKAAGLPVARGGLDADASDRYSRHLRLPEIGLDGQGKLAAARVLVVGAGGLGSPCLLYLAAAGVGELRVVDDDRVERSNLQRQVLHNDARIGIAKAESARATLEALNPRIRVDARVGRLGEDNVDALVADCDLVVDGSDNLSTRYLLSDRCVVLRKPLVYAAVHRFEGQVTVFDAGRRRGQSPCYRCLFPLPPERDAAPNCAEVGVLGAVPGVLGLLQATEALKLILGLGESLDGRLLCVDLLSMEFRSLRLRPDPDCPACGAGGAPLSVPGQVCASDGAG
ncbi:molybdopterin-synthase adenylyltransferase MoeB [Pseudomarimonas salicorniae]|uniref:Molybdopterin-synthase adenylyltransferase MoeB n=1 Tax=Pseudomarimonas salicorniae TaxID=2933270 RepID=A0ABT0GG38_9GAMM|nr:molybdopterin-synthase adenylyltransferase MoeB [Lysobacter sp. CAU 1642]